MEKVLEKLEKAKASCPVAVAMDVDSAGLPFLSGQGGDAGPKSVEALNKIATAAGLPFLVKGVMTPNCDGAVLAHVVIDDVHIQGDLPQLFHVADKGGAGALAPRPGDLPPAGPAVALTFFSWHLAVSCRHRTGTIS